MRPFCKKSCKGYSPSKGYSLCKIVTLGQKLKMPKNAKNDSTRTSELFYAKNRSKKHQIFEKRDHFEDHFAKAIAHAKAIAFAKLSLWAKNKKFQRHAIKRFPWTLELFCAKSCSKKHQRSEKWYHFENRPSCKGYSPCKGYTLCKMVSLGQKLKIAKNMRKTILRPLELFVQKTALKNTKYSRNETILTICHLAKAIAQAKAIAFAKLSPWVKN